MDNQQVEHLQQQRNLSIQRLRKLQNQQALFGSTCPPEIQIEIEQIETKIVHIEQEIEYILGHYATNNQDNSQAIVSYSDPPSSDLPWGAIITGIIIVIIIGSCTANQLSKNRLSDSFSLSNGLGSWRTNGNVTLVQDGKDSVDGNKSGLQIQGANSYAFQVIEEKTTQAEIYTATVWCKAPIGGRCRLFLGDVQEGISLPISESNRTITRDGTGKWESMAITTNIDKDVRLAVFLYAESNSDAVTYDDISVVK